MEQLHRFLRASFARAGDSDVVDAGEGVGDGNDVDGRGGARGDGDGKDWSGGVRGGYGDSGDRG